MTAEAGAPVPATSPENSGEAASSSEAAGRYARVRRWAQRVGLERKVAVLFLIGTIASGTVTLMGMTDNLPVVLDPLALLLLLNLDLILLLGLSALIARRLVILWVARKRGLAGAHLHVRLAALFGLVAVTPTIIIATFSVILFDFGLQGWFSDRVRTAVEESFAVARAYLNEHQQSISADALGIAQMLNRQGVTLALNPQLFSRMLAAQVGVRSLTEALVFDRSGRILGSAGYSLLLEYDPEIPDWALRRADDGEVVILTSESEDRVRALLRLDGFANTYLYVGRLIDPRVLAHIDTTENAVKLYRELEGKRSGLQLTFALIFVVVALMLLLAATWVGLSFANQLSRPIGSLIAAAHRVGAGDLSARVTTREDFGEIGSLARAFNRMTEELALQREKLLQANQQLDYRSRFIEAVLGGVSAGVIGLDENGVITLPNRSASQLLSTETELLRGRPLAEAVPEMADLLEEARARPRRLAERMITLVRGEGGPRRLLVRIAAEVQDGRTIGYVVTFDDITELLSAQRKAAWADVARRIAHEIKNPLTPIQLSAERLKRKYLKEIRSDPETFQTCTDVIVRHVGDIGRMVDEFSAFARMPAPAIVDTDLSEVVRQAVFLQRGAHPDVTFELDLPAGDLIVPCDREQIGRALTNLLQNAVEAIARRPVNDGAPPPPGRIHVRLAEEDDCAVIEVADNGCGLPRSERHRLTEPYVTTRDQGTGLGLAIVKKIMEDHGGNLYLEDNPGGGARLRLVFPLRARRPESEPYSDSLTTTGEGTRKIHGM
ncbi:MAG: PAS domain-containing sensor histidine kinase [Alphaproteobacteria bacterium]|nr:MAG: PAS domain-containing sensor histidine kinase [Alphaproteobacteria bacterium]